MNRREALRKLAAGGAAAATASVVVSTPAFAYTSPTPPAAPLLSASVSGFLNSILTVTMNPSTATCPASAVGGTSIRGVAYSTALAGPLTVSLPTGSAPSGPLVVAFTRTALGAGSATINYRVRYRCSYAGQNADICRSWSIVYAFGAGFSPWPVVPTSLTTGTACP